MKKNGKKWNKYLYAGIVMTGIAVVLGILGFFWTPYSTTAMSASEKFSAPSLRHLFGTDNNIMDLKIFVDAGRLPGISGVYWTSLSCASRMP